MCVIFSEVYTSSLEAPALSLNLQGSTQQGMAWDRCRSPQILSRVVRFLQKRNERSWMDYWTALLS